MHRNKLLNLLESYHPITSKEINDKPIIIDFIKNNPDCFNRLNSGHVTASCWLLSKCGEKALLTHHKKLNKWLQLGGHADGDHDALNVALQEAREESGIENIEPLSHEIYDIDIHLIPKNFRDDEHYHYDIRFLLQVKSDEYFKVSDESHALMWIDRNTKQLPPNCGSLTRLFNKWANK